MAELGSKPYRIIERRSSHGYYRDNSLFEAATASNQRKRVPTLSKDSHALVSRMGRNLLMWVGRVLYANSPAVAGIINEQAAMAAQNMKPVFDGEDKEWGEQAEEQLRLWHRIMCLEGPQYDRGTFLRTALISMVRDCDASYLLTSTSAGYPKVQALPAHRIDEPSHSVVVDGQWKGRTIIDGVIIDDYRRPLAYRVWDNNQTTFKDIPARHVGLWFDPTWQDQVRGFSKLAVGAFSFLDLKESRDFELLAQKVSATYTVLEQTETGLYQLGPFALELGLRAMARHDFVDRAAARMPALAEDTGMTVLLSIWGGLFRTACPISCRKSVANRSNWSIRARTRFSAMRGCNCSSLTARASRSGGFRRILMNSRSPCRRNRALARAPASSAISMPRMKTWPARCSPPPKPGWQARG
jgi:hypothetical protein